MSRLTLKMRQSATYSELSRRHASCDGVSTLVLTTTPPAPSASTSAFRCPPLKVYASSSSNFCDFDARLDLRFRDERGPVGDDLFDFGATAREARHGGRPREYERRDLFREALDRRAVGAAHADAKLNFGRFP